MTAPTYPSAAQSHRHADIAVHAVGLFLILTAGGFLVFKASAELEVRLALAAGLYVACALVSNLASCCYHFAPWHDRRKLLRRIDHAAIYPSISGTFTPFFVQADTLWTLTLLWLCWGLTALAVWNKITHETVKSRWSTASYLGLGALGMCALPDLTNVPVATLWHHCRRRLLCHRNRVLHPQEHALPLSCLARLGQSGRDIYVCRDLDRPFPVGPRDLSPTCQPCPHHSSAALCTPRLPPAPSSCLRPASKREVRAGSRRAVCIRPWLLRSLEEGLLPRGENYQYK
ncbi:PAQR family membrane homeostasis protein TrhA [Pseudophaeobacter leonis]|uniref:PAQR family membrane homeostasis protein TrhA n=1 Tax=Pseudophaeobacter leonis TaxID=1144477 RepID=UPI0030C6AA52